MKKLSLFCAILLLLIAINLNAQDDEPVQGGTADDTGLIAEPSPYPDNGGTIIDTSETNEIDSSTDD